MLVTSEEAIVYPVTHLVVHAQDPDAAPVGPPAIVPPPVRRSPRADAEPIRVAGPPAIASRPDRRARSSQADGVAIRVARSADAAALAELAELDGAPRIAGRLSELAADPAKGTVLVADYDGRPAAALDVEGDVAVADPFESTASLVDLLRLRARQLRGAGGRPAWLGVRRLRPIGRLRTH